MLSAAVASGVTSVALGADPAAIDTWYLGAVDGLLERVLAGHSQARRMGADYLRQHAALEGHRVTPAPVSLNVAQARTALRVTGPVAFKTAIAAGIDPPNAIVSMSTQMSGAASRLALAGDRDTLHETVKSGGGIAGYRRVIGGGHGCAFCVMLASRGAVYATEITASRTDSGRRYHDHCDCYPEPLYAREQEPSEVRALQNLWRKATGGQHGADAQRAWRRFWEARQRAIRAAGPGGATKIPALTTSAADPSGVVGAAAAAVAGPTVRPMLASAKTLSRVDDVFRAEYERITGRRTLTDVEFKGNLQTAREHAEGLLRGLERFPDVNLVRVATNTRSSYAQAVTWAEMPATKVAPRVASGGRIEFNAKWTKDRKRYLDSLTNDTASGWHPAGTASPMGVAVHEFGHVLDLSTLSESIRPDLQRLIFRRTTERDNALDALKAAGRPIPAEDFIAGRGASGLIHREISEYALKNHRELVAEAFADVMTNGPAASQLSREVFDLLEAAYRKGGRRVGVAGSSASEALDIAKMTVPQLKALAKARGITGYSKMLKADLIKALGGKTTPVKAAKAAKAAPPKKSSERTVKAGDFSGLTRVESSKMSGTNPGGLYRADDGSVWYIKSLTDADHVNNEALAAEFYRAVGVDVPELAAGRGAPGLTGQHQIASRVDPRTQDSTYDPTRHKGATRRLREGFAADAWLANWDVMGAGFGNIARIGAGGSVRRIDVGGALIFRGGVGAPKGPKFGDTVPEWKTLRDPTRSRHAAQVFGGMTQEELRASVDRIKAITPTKIRALVRKHNMPPELAGRLIARRNDIIAQLDREFAPKVGPTPAILKARDKFDAQLAVAKINQDGLDQAALRISGAGSSTFKFDNPATWKRRLGIDVEEVKRAFRAYRGEHFQDINGLLRGKNAPTPNVNRWIDNIEKALAQSKLKESVVVWRGVRTGESVFGPRASWPDDLTGAEWTDPAFFSTSVDRTKAEGFAGKVLMRFVFPKGTPAVQLSGYEYEAELMIGAGYRFRVIRDRGEGKTQWGVTVDRILDVEVIPPKRAAGVKVP